jgi:hypothetical protein
MWTRADWRSAAAGRDRQAYQRILWEMAEAARYSTPADRLALLTGAHAVLPLHGYELGELVRLLIDPASASASPEDERARVLCWSDALLAALADADALAAPQRWAVVESLRHACGDEAPRSPVEERRRAFVMRQLESVGALT